MASNDDVLKAAHLCIAENRLHNTAVDLQVSAIAHPTPMKNIPRSSITNVCSSEPMNYPCQPGCYISVLASN